MLVLSIAAKQVPRIPEREREQKQQQQQQQQRALHAAGPAQKRTEAAAAVLEATGRQEARVEVVVGAVSVVETARALEEAAVDTSTPAAICVCSTHSSRMQPSPPNGRAGVLSTRCSFSWYHWRGCSIEAVPRFPVADDMC